MSKSFIFSSSPTRPNRSPPQPPVADELTPTCGDLTELEAGQCRVAIDKPRAEGYGYCGRRVSRRDPKRRYCDHHLDAFTLKQEPRGATHPARVF